jgi:hypothetical protein
MNELRTVVLLEAIRHAGSPDYPITNNWSYLMEEIETLATEGLLELKDDKYVISDKGKRVLLLFRSDKKDILKHMEAYTEVKVNGKTVDARLPLAAFRARKLSDEDAEEYLRNLAYLIGWDSYFENLKYFAESDFNWQEHLFKSFERQGIVNRNCWSTMGRTLKEAVLTCERLIHPVPNRSLIHLIQND